VHRLRLQRSFVKIWRVAGCEILEIGEQNWGDIGVPSAVFASLFSLNP
jgi:hypothetical protein